jgi:hypothetical protein
MPIWGEERREWPAPLARQGLNGCLVSSVNIRPLIHIDFDGHKMLVDEAGNLRVFIRLNIHNMTPVAPDGANI